MRVHRPIHADGDREGFYHRHKVRPNADHVQTGEHDQRSIHDPAVESGADGSLERRAEHEGGKEQEAEAAEYRQHQYREVSAGDRCRRRERVREHAGQRSPLVSISLAKEIG